MSRLPPANSFARLRFARVRAYSFTGATDGDDGSVTGFSVESPEVNVSFSDLANTGLTGIGVMSAFSAPTLSFTKRAGTGGLSYAIQESTDLGIADTWAEVTAVPPPILRMTQPFHTP